MSFKRFKKMKKCGMACLVAVSLTGTSFVPYMGLPVRVEAATKLAVTETNGDMENASVIWQKTDAEGYNVYYKGASDNTFVQVDDELIRQYGDTYRVDIPGLRGGDYTISVVPIQNQKPNFDAAAVKKVNVKSNVREGFAFAPSSPTQGAVSGGYQNDGTPQEGAQILYINKDNVNTVSLDVIVDSKGTKKTQTGLTTILSARKKGYDTTPLILRVIGTLSSTDVEGLNSNGYLEVKGVKNVTLEGIGSDATLYGIGVLVRDCTNVEVRNLGLMKFPDDGVSLDTDNQNIWVHNNDFFYGTAGSDADQAKGDGSCDIKGKSTYVTVSYNHFWDSGKSSLCGMNDTEEFFVTYHHNWFDHSDSRHARIRVGSIHLYNNYYDGNSKYGVGVTKGASAFVEKNVFRNCKYPMMSSQQGTDIADGAKGTFSGENGGIIKAFDNEITGAKAVVYTKDDATQFDAYLASSQDEKVPDTYKTVQGGTSYNNFDTDSSKFYSYTPTETSKVKEEVTTYAGRVQGGDVKWSFSDADDTDYGIQQELMTTLNNYKASVTKFGGNGVRANYGGSDVPDASDDVIAPTPSVEPTPSTKPTPSAEPAPSTEPTPSAEPTPSTEPTPSVEPTPSTKPTPSEQPQDPVISLPDDADSIESQMEIGTMGISGGGFVSGIVTGKDVMYARTDVGGAYKYNYDTNRWEQLFGFLTDAERGLLSVDAMCIDPNDDNTVYFLCGCAYFSDARTVIMRTKDGGKTFDEIDVTKLIQVHGNGQGRQFGEAIAVDPDNSDILYCGGDTGGLIKSTDGGDTWKMVDGYSKLGLFKEEIKWPTWTDNIVKTTDKEYYTCNGIGNVAIANGKVFVGTSITGEANMHVADISKDEFTPLSSELPTDLLPSHINKDCEGNLLISYVKGIAFDGSAGAGYRYNVKTGELTDISPTSNKGDKPGTGSIVSDPTDPNKLVATTCGLWWGQMWEKDAWENNKVCYGDITLRSEDGGKTWRQMLPGECSGWGDTSTLMTDYLQDNGRSWIRNKAVHWSGSIVLDPKNPSRFLVTSGNGVFACDDVWADLPSIHFQADGIEEVVSLDATCTPDGTFYSVIGDYDGFKHISTTESVQFSPTMDQNPQAQNASVGAIAYCPTNPDIMVRYSEGGSAAYYSKDGGDTWTELPSSVSGGKAAIAQLDDNTYRIFRTGSGTVSYTDDFGASWKQATGTEGSSTLWTCVDEKNPKYVYAYGYYYNPYYNGSSDGKDPTIDDARYTLMVSSDYGATFEKQTICLYDRCDSAYRIAYLDEGKFVLAAGYQGAYLVTDYGKTVTKLESMPYCKTIGYGAPKTAGGPNTLFAWGKPQGKDVEGVYCSTDEGKTWIAVDIKNTYGGTGNGNYIVGNKKEFGTFYMSTVGCGIVYGRLKNGSSGGGETSKPEKVSVKEISLKKDTLELTVGSQSKLSYTITPSDATDKTVSWKSSDTKVAEVDQKGNVNAVGVGSAEITVTTNDGAKTAVCKVTVTDKNSEEQPSDADKPSKEEQPSDTSKPEQPSSQPSNGSEPEIPSGQPSSASEPGKPSKQPSNASEPGKPSGQPSNGNEPNQPSDQPSDTSKPEKPSDVSQPQQPSNTSEPGKPSDVSQPSKGSEPGKPSNVSQPQQPSNTSDTGKPSSQPSEGSKPEKPSDVSQPSSTSEGSKPATPTNPGTPSNPDTPSTNTPSGGSTAQEPSSNQTPSVIPVRTITLNHTNLELKVGEKAKLSYTIEPTNATNPTVEWEVAKGSEEYVSLAEDGTITALAPGRAIITVSSQDGYAFNVCFVNVTKKDTDSTDVKVTGVTLDREHLDMVRGDLLKLTETITPANASNPEVFWESTKPQVVAVNQNGVITAVAEGSAEVRVTTKDGSYQASCQITVKTQTEANKPSSGDTSRPSVDAPVSVIGVVLDATEWDTTEGKTKLLTPTILPENATNKNLTWSSTDPDVARVDAYGMVYALSAGQTTITAKTADGGKQASCKVTVRAENTDSSDKEITSLKANKSSLTLEVKKTFSLKITIKPTDATDKELSFTSSKKSVATVSSSGKIKAVAPGKSTITVKAKNGKKTKVNVKVIPAKVTGVSAKQPANGQIKVTWKKLSGISQYQISYYDPKKGSYTSPKTVSKNSYTLKNCKKNATYKFKVRAKKKQDGTTYYGNYSSIIKIKVKK